MDINTIITKKLPINKFHDDFIAQQEWLTNGNKFLIDKIMNFFVTGGDFLCNEDGYYYLRDKSDEDLIENAKKLVATIIMELSDEVDRIICGFIGVNEGNIFNHIKNMRESVRNMLSYNLDEVGRKHYLIASNNNDNAENILLRIYSFTHILINRFVYEYLTDTQKRKYHIESADVILSLYNYPEKETEIKKQLVWHLEKAGITPDNKAYSYLYSSKNQAKDFNLITEARSRIEKSKKNYKDYYMHSCIENVESALRILSEVKTLSFVGLEEKFTALLYLKRALIWLGHYDRAISASKELLATAERQNHFENIVTALFSLGDVYRNSENFIAALRHYNKAMENATESNDKIWMMKCANKIGVLHQKYQKNDVAIEMHCRALAIAEHICDNEEIAFCYNYIANALKDKGEYDRATTFYSEAIQIAKDMHNMDDLGTFYNNATFALLGKKDYDSAISYYKKAIEIAESENDRCSLGTYYCNLAFALVRKKNYDNAIIYFKKSLLIAESQNDRVKLESRYSALADLLVTIKDYNKALIYLKRGIFIAQKMKNELTIKEYSRQISLIKKRL